MGLGLAGDRERGEHDRQVRVDAVAEPVEDGRAARSDLAIRNALHLVKVVVGGLWVPRTVTRHLISLVERARPTSQSPSLARPA